MTVRFRYFVLGGGSLERFLELEREERGQYAKRDEEFIKRGVERYRLLPDGGILSLVFEEGKMPPGMKRASKKFDKSEVMPKVRGEESREWRELLALLKVTKDCNREMILEMRLPTSAYGGPSKSGSGRRVHYPRIGHVGEAVYVEMPENTVGEKPVFDGPPNEEWASHPDLTEVKEWEYLKAWDDRDEQEMLCLTLPPRGY